MKTVFVSGVFNVVHPGHIRLFHFARELGDRLESRAQRRYYPVGVDLPPSQQPIAFVTGIQVVVHIAVEVNQVLAHARAEF